MARTDYQQQLEQLRTNVVEMSDAVSRRLQRALEAYERKDDALAAEVIAGDDEINRRYLELERACIELLALQQPVASDLRFVAASFKIITDLERIGDLAVNLGEYTRRAERDRYPDVDIARVGAETVAMVEDATRAYADGDAAATRAIAARDDEIDERLERASRTVVRNLVETEPDDVDAVLEDVSRMLLTIRDIERVGDHAVNVAARTLYMVDDDDGLIY
ncbi:phosphate signaling complex protein PhoU [Natronococcus jeotgali]|uniref:Phosphate-specific transport system accessory protein PhoU n=1 Tax=Natronococcus jeotgali DSM 18795 TaxID=1227498 RepID=L9XX30_9EURY|nr:phosphate signaling complex protein PhoU [Natronococcus jeotgali]ELY66394.1 phosphate uptake regulator PhoU [Natronococcus jeotgali DSM 18795]